MTLTLDADASGTAGNSLATQTQHVMLRAGTVNVFTFDLATTPDGGPPADMGSDAGTPDRGAPLDLVGDRMVDAPQTTDLGGDVQMDLATDVPGDTSCPPAFQCCSDADCQSGFVCASHNCVCGT